MRFLMVCMQKYPFPPEAAAYLLESMKDWSKKYVGARKIEENWAFAGLKGGGGILNVNSLEELNSIIAEFPFNQFADVQIYPLTNIDRALDEAIEGVKRMTPVKV